MSANKFVSIIIPAYNEEDNIAKCLQSINAQMEQGIDYEIIVVDNGSTDRTREIAEKLKAKVFALPEVNISALRNFGAEASSGDILAFLDADCLVKDGWLKNAVSILDDPAVAMVGSS
jgi:glycosyltransferase involved in cell wall biosynthesis